MPFWGILLTVTAGTAFGGPRTVKVQIHTVQGSGITEADVNGWVDRANEIDSPQIRYVVDSNHVYPPGTPYDVNINDPCRVNIWGVSTNPWAVDHPNNVDPNVSAQWGSVVILVPGDGNDTFIKDSTLAHELNHILGLGHVDDDPNNKMHPDNWPDSNGVLKSCHRTDTQLTDDQRRTMRRNALPFARDAMSDGRGGEVYDDAHDVSKNFIDLHWAQLWVDRIGGHYIFHMTAQVDVLSFTYPSEIGFYIESDNNEMTGDPLEGLDYYIAYRPQSGEILFQQYEFTGWVTLPPPPGAITYELTYAHPDSNLPSIPIGIEMELDLDLVIIGQVLAGDFAFKAAATDSVEIDLAPNTGLLKCSYPPVPIPGDLNLDNKVNIDDIEIMVQQWTETGSRLRADISPAGGDGMVRFDDFAVLANNWKAEGIP